jgi:hypothetical protein
LSGKGSHKARNVICLLRVSSVETGHALSLPNKKAASLSREAAFRKKYEND